ncbi:MAG: hypothetical protein LKCHEGNO_01531 [Burkholderiaceae bacterium]|nr:hypothetical protein [Burkholderiaceae bacterium]
MTTSEPRLFVPRSIEGLTQDDVWRWFLNIEREIGLLSLSSAERKAFESYYRSAGLLRGWRRPFFRHHYSRPLWLATSRLFGTTQQPRILDLGCGTGTQSLLFALLGAKVVGVDMDERALSVLSKRKALYEQTSGRRLCLTLLSGDVFELDLQGLAPLDGVYSLFAFNMMQPTAELLNRLSPRLDHGAIIAIHDGNREHFFNAIFRRRFASTRALQSMLRSVGFSEVERLGGYAIPPVFWAIVPRQVLDPVDRLLTKSERLAVSYLHVAHRPADLRFTEYRRGVADPSEMGGRADECRLVECTAACAPA